MTEHDDELRKLLRQWETPEPRPQLDARVWKSVRQARTAPKRRWLPIAAGVILAIGSATLWMSRSQSLNIETKVEADGFRPLAEGKITIVKGTEQ